MQKFSTVYGLYNSIVKPLAEKGFVLLAKLRLSDAQKRLLNDQEQIVLMQKVFRDERWKEVNSLFSSIVPKLKEAEAFILECRHSGTAKLEDEIAAVNYQELIDNLSRFDEFGKKSNIPLIFYLLVVHLVKEGSGDQAERELIQARNRNNAVIPELQSHGIWPLLSAEQQINIKSLTETVANRLAGLHKELMAQKSINAGKRKKSFEDLGFARKKLPIRSLKASAKSASSS